MRFRVLFCLFLPLAVSGETDTARTILERTAKAYREVRSYQIEIRSLHTLRADGQTKVSESRIGVAEDRPGKYRWETSGSGGSELRISAGGTLWTYRPDLGEYTTAAAGTAAPGPIAALEQINENVTAADIAREETLQVSGQAVDCYVIKVERREWPAGIDPATAFAMYRIDKKTSVVYKQVEYARHSAHTLLYSLVKWNEAVPEDLFAFHPPEGSKKVEAFTTPESVSEGAAMIGTEAPDFTLKDVDGQSVDLKSYRGKVVLVDFWASWCPPCQKEMPHLEKMHREMQEKGLVVLGLDVGESAETVRDFAREHHYTFTLLLGAEPEIAAKYHVDGYPTVFLVDRAGKIVGRFAGMPQTDLRGEVEKVLSSSR
jgi:peroxiredoxin/outer membrane lipoprotein-sorting protein